jgi:anti-sigma B factor antagonist
MNVPNVDASGEVFEIDVDRDRDPPVVVVRGEVDVATAPVVLAELHRLLDAGVSHIVVDLAAMEFIDSSGLGVFVGALRRMRDTGGRLELVNLQPGARRVFDVTGLTEAFGIE